MLWLIVLCFLLIVSQVSIQENKYQVIIFSALSVDEFQGEPGDIRAVREDDLKHSTSEAGDLFKTFSWMYFFPGLLSHGGMVSRCPVSGSSAVGRT